ncbi:MAG: hypothetical protein QW727_01540 [Candidatus Pacearchaeota archaeon]
MGKLIHFGEDDTSEKNVKHFLERVEDYNSLHWENSVMPGMYVVFLIQRFIKKPISRINASFNGLVLFPENLEVILEEGSRTHFKVMKRNEKVYEGDFHHDSCQSNMGLDYTFPIYLIGGKLQVFYSQKGIFPLECFGVYRYQSMDFFKNGENFSKLYFSKLERLNKRDYNIVTKCLSSSNNKIIAEGHAVISVINKKTICHLIKVEEDRKRFGKI